MEIILNNYSNLLSKIKKQIQQTESSIVKTMTRQKVVMSWEIGKQINDYLSKHDEPKYGDKLIDQLSKDILIDKSILYKMRKFNNSYPALPKDDDLLNWTHYRILIGVKEQDKRLYLENLTRQNSWDTKTLANRIKRLKSDKKAIEKTAIKESNEASKLKPSRGTLFTYPLINLINSNQTYIDCGFHVFKTFETEIKTGNTVTSIKTNKDYSLQKVDTLGKRSKKLNIYKAKLERVVDGDTIRVNLDLGFGIIHRETLRLKGINAPELKADAGKKSSKTLSQILKSTPFLIIKTIKIDIFGRYVADVFFDENKNEKANPQEVADKGVYLNQLLLDKGTARLFK